MAVTLPDVFMSMFRLTQLSTAKDNLDLNDTMTHYRQNTFKQCPYTKFLFNFKNNIFNERNDTTVAAKSLSHQRQPQE